jgi:LytS/YehU family sensor histidine kinase
MLRYQLYEIKGEKIPIEKEIAYLKDYIGLQLLRNENCSVQFNIDEGMKSFLVEPLLLIPFVENSFKHLSHFGQGKKNEIQIDLAKQNGLNNVKRRLELLYPQRHELNISDKDGWFGVQLKIKMN